MQRKVRYVLVATLALILGSIGAESYARLMIPYYQVVTAGIAQLHPWRILDISVNRGTKSPSAELRLTGEVRHARGDLEPAARVVVHLQVGEVVEAPVVFWAVVCAWPMATLRRRLFCIVVAVPLFLLLEAMTTGCQLVHSLAEASAMLAGDPDPLTVWERWSRFLEAGGRFALELCAALLTVALSGTFNGLVIRSQNAEVVGSCSCRRSKSSSPRRSTLRDMESKVAKEAERALIEATQRLTPEERLNAFLRHCRLVMQLHVAGARMRADRSSKQP